MGKMNHKGRSKSDNIVIVSRFDMRTEAYTHLSVHGRAALLELLYRFNGANNGEIQISVRQLGKALNCGKNKAGDVFLELQDKGWIKYNKKGSFDWKTHTNRLGSVVCATVSASANLFSILRLQFPSKGSFGFRIS